MESSFSESYKQFATELTECNLNLPLPNGERRDGSFFEPTCSECSRRFSSRSNLNRHRLEVHNLESEIISYAANVYKNLTCGEDDCNSSFVNIHHLRQHLFDVHRIEKNAVRHMEFSSYEEFEGWLDQEQQDTVTNYNVTTGPIRAHTRTSYFNCHRSGKALLKEDTFRKRKTKCQGSCKINKTCTSQIVLKRNVETDRCSILYYFQHYGHETEVQHIRIHKQDRELIASKLMAGESIQNILTDLKRGVEGDELIRLKRIGRKDIYNIKMSLKRKIKNNRNLNPSPVDRTK